MICCKICGKEFKHRLGSHIHVHDITIQQYYDLYIDHNSTKYCPICGKENTFNGLTKGYSAHCSLICKGKDEAVKEKVKQTSLQKYGAENVYASEYGKQKIKNTNLERYGVENPQQNQQIRQKANDTFISRYGGIGWGSKQLLEKTKKTWQQKYGSTNPGAFGTVLYKNALLQRYGVDNPQKDANIKQKTEQTCLLRYGCKNPAQNLEIRNKSEKQHYRYKNINFDSSWELAVWIYYTDKKVKIEREPLRLSYLDSKNNTHYYFPDFKIYGQLIEVKASWRLQRLLGTAKHKCMLKNNVIVWDDDLIKPFLLYCEHKYKTKQWANQFNLKYLGR